MLTILSFPGARQKSPEACRAPRGNKARQNGESLLARQCLEMLATALILWFLGALKYFCRASAAPRKNTHPPRRGKRGGGKIYLIYILPPLPPCCLASVRGVRNHGCRSNLVCNFPVSNSNGGLNNVEG